MSSRLSTSTTAMLFLELQNDFLSDGGTLHDLVKPVLAEVDLTANANTLIRGARAAGAIVVHTPILFSPDYREMGPNPQGILKVVRDANALIKGTWGGQIAETVEIEDADIIVDGKSSIDAFAGTNLDHILRARQISTIVLGGFLTNICIESTMRSAYDKGYRVLALTDATATYGLDEQRISQSHNWPMFCESVTHTETLKRLVAPAAA